jgi:gluconate kinase
VFKTPAWPELKRRLASRPGKTIPRKVVKSMIHNFEQPSEEEGFTEIWYT